MVATVLCGFLLVQLALNVLAVPINNDPKPAHTEPDENPDCIDWIIAYDGEDCSDLSSRAGIVLKTFQTWNPALLRDCHAVKAGWGYCIAISDVSGPTTTTTTQVTTPIQTTTTLGPQPTTTSFQYDTSQFPPSAGTIQCAKPSTPNPNPVAIDDGAYLQNAITAACQQLVGNSKWLEKGNPYTSNVVSDGEGHLTQFALQIKLGGFSVTQDLCITSLQAVMPCHADDDNTKTFGGCTYSSDYNFQACIFPTGEKGTAPSPPVSPTSTTPPSQTPTSSSPSKPDPTQFPPSNGRVQCVPSNMPGAKNNIMDEGAVPWGCNIMVGDGKWLEKGNPYSFPFTDNGDTLTFDLIIKLGGFNVTRQICTDTLNQVLSCQHRDTQPPLFTGGCAYSEDYNLQGCIFP